MYVPSGVFLSGFLTKILHQLLVALMHATCPTNLILLDLIIMAVFGEKLKLWRSSLCTFLQPPVGSPLSLCSPLNVNNQVSHSYKTTGKIIVLYIDMR
jgi:hypothetical protein